MKGAVACAVGIIRTSLVIKTQLRTTAQHGLSCSLCYLIRCNAVHCVWLLGLDERLGRVVAALHVGALAPLGGPADAHKLQLSHGLTEPGSSSQGRSLSLFGVQGVQRPGRAVGCLGLQRTEAGLGNEG